MRDGDGGGPGHSIDVEVYRGIYPRGDVDMYRFEAKRYIIDDHFEYSRHGESEPASWMTPDNYVTAEPNEYEQAIIDAYEISDYKKYVDEKSVLTKVYDIEVDRLAKKYGI